LFRNRLRNLFPSGSLVVDARFLSIAEIAIVRLCQLVAHRVSQSQTGRVLCGAATALPSKETKMFKPVHRAILAGTATLGFAGASGAQTSSAFADCASATNYASATAHQFTSAALNRANCQPSEAARAENAAITVLKAFGVPRSESDSIKACYTRGLYTGIVETLREEYAQCGGALGELRAESYGAAAEAAFVTYVNVLSGPVDMTDVYAAFWGTPVSPAPAGECRAAIAAAAAADLGTSPSALLASGILATVVCGSSASLQTPPRKLVCSSDLDSAAEDNGAAYGAARLRVALQTGTVSAFAGRVIRRFNSLVALSPQALCDLQGVINGSAEELAAPGIAKNCASRSAAWGTVVGGLVCGLSGTLSVAQLQSLEIGPPALPADCALDAACGSAYDAAIRSCAGSPPEAAVTSIGAAACGG
jgi:hypothetical protein